MFKLRMSSSLQHKAKSEYSTIFTEPEENNSFSIITQVIIRATSFSFILFVSFLERKRAGAILKISACTRC